MMDEQREQLLARFRAYLEQDPIDTPQPEAPDLHTLLAELAAIKNEVKLETRQVKTALDQFGEVFDALGESSRSLRAELDRQRERAAIERREAEQTLLLELLELHDRLCAGHEQAARYAPGWLARSGGAKGFVTGMAEGMAMNLRRLDELLLRRGIRTLEVLHRSFDPHTMHAVDTAQLSELPAGTVVREVRRGFLRDGRVLRAAEVIVNKRENDS